MVLSRQDVHGALDCILTQFFKDSIEPDLQKDGDSQLQKGNSQMQGD